MRGSMYCVIFNVEYCKTTNYSRPFKYANFARSNNSQTLIVAKCFNPPFQKHIPHNNANCNGSEIVLLVKTQTLMAANISGFTVLDVQCCKMSFMENRGACFDASSEVQTVIWPLLSISQLKGQIPCNLIVIITTLLWYDTIFNRLIRNHIIIISMESHICLFWDINCFTVYLCDCRQIIYTDLMADA